MSLDDKTRVTLLAIVGDPGHSEYGSAWAEFDKIYKPLILAWLFQLGIRGQNADELAVDILGDLVAKIDRFSAWRPSGSSHPQNLTLDIMI